MKIVKLIILGITIPLLIGISIGYFQLISKWKNICTEEEMQHNATIISSSSKLPRNFYNVYDKIYPNSRSYSMTEQTISEIFNNYRDIKDCKCDEVGYLILQNSNLKLKANPYTLLGKYREFGFGIEKFTTPEICFEFWLNNDILWNNTYLKNLNELSLLALNKDIKDLKDEEIIELIAWRGLQNRAVTNPKLLQKRVKELKRRKLIQ